MNVNGQASVCQARHRKLRDRQPLAYTGVVSGVREYSQETRL